MDLHNLQRRPLYPLSSAPPGWSVSHLVGPDAAGRARTYRGLSIREVISTCVDTLVETEEGIEALQAILELCRNERRQGNDGFLDDILAAARLVPERPFRRAHGVNLVIVHSFNVSCQCDRLDLNRDMVGMVIYSYQGSGAWELNGVRCRAGYIVIKLADNLLDVTGQSMHARLYNSVFDQGPGQDVIATGFAIRRGVWTFSSRTFNQGYSNCEVSETEQQLIRAAVQRRYSPGATHADKKFPIVELRNRIVVLPS